MENANKVVKGIPPCPLGRFLPSPAPRATPSPVPPDTNCPTRPKIPHATRHGPFTRRFQPNKVVEGSPPCPLCQFPPSPDPRATPSPVPPDTNRRHRHRSTPSLPSHTTTRLRIDTLLLGTPAPFHIRASPRSFAVCPVPPPRKFTRCHRQRLQPVSPTSQTITKQSQQKKRRRRTASCLESHPEHCF